MDSQLVLIATAKEGTISSLEHRGGDLKPLAVSEVGAPGMPLAVDPANDLVFAGGSDPRGVTVLRLDRTSGELEVLGRYETRGVPAYLTLSSDAGLLFSASYHQGRGEVFRVGDAGALARSVSREYRNLHCVQLTRRQLCLLRLTSRRPGRPVRGCPYGELMPLIRDRQRNARPGHARSSTRRGTAYLTTEYAGVALHYRRDRCPGCSTRPPGPPPFPPTGVDSRFGAPTRAEDLIWCSDLH